MNIREFGIDDIEQVVTLWQLCELTVAWNDPRKDIRRKLEVGPELFLVGELDSTLIGTVMGGYDGHRGWINYLAVSPNHQKQGYGQDLMREIEVRLLAQGCPKINLQIRSTNQQVIDFYSHLGFAEDKVRSFGKRLIPDE